jgi:hypothetical protein
MMVLRLNTLMVLAVAADECMCQLFPVRGGDGQLKFAANDDGSCIAEKLFRAPRLEAGEELIVGDTNVARGVITYRGAFHSPLDTPTGHGPSRVHPE